jgi:hypothetical protein
MAPFTALPTPIGAIHRIGISWCASSRERGPHDSKTRQGAFGQGVAVGIDGGRIYDERRRAQNAADHAATAIRNSQLFAADRFGFPPLFCELLDEFRILNSPAYASRRTLIRSTGTPGVETMGREPKPQIFK